MRTPEDYFEPDEDGIRLKGHRMWLENILDLYKEGMNAQQIAETFSTLSVDETQAAIDYYHRHTAEVDAYMEQQTREALEREREADEHPSPYALRMHALLEERMRANALKAAQP